MKVTTLAGRVRWFKRIGEGGGTQSFACSDPSLGLSMAWKSPRHSTIRCKEGLLFGVSSPGLMHILASHIRQCSLACVAAHRLQHPQTTPWNEPCT